MKFVLVLYLCSMNTGLCQSSHYAGYQFNTHYDCVNSGYAIAQSTFRNLKKYEEFEREKIEREKIVVKFECKGIMIDDKDKEKDDTNKKLGIES